MAYSFQAKFAVRGNQDYKNTTWEEDEIGDKVFTELKTAVQSKPLLVYLNN